MTEHINKIKIHKAEANVAKIYLKLLNNKLLNYYNAAL